MVPESEDELVSELEEDLLEDGVADAVNEVVMVTEPVSLLETDSVPDGIDETDPMADEVT